MREPSTPEPSAPERAECPPTGRGVPFPLTRVALPALGVAVSVWMWFAWGYRWDVTPRDLAGGRAPFGAVGGWSGRYVRLTGCRPVAGAPPGDSRLGAVRAFEGEDGSVVFVTGPASDPDRPAGRAAPAEVQDRLVFVVRADAGRWTTRSVLAVLVGLWGAAITVSVSAAWLHLRREGGPAKSGRD